MKTTLLALIFIVMGNALFAQDFDSTNTQNVKWQSGPLTVESFHIADAKERNPDSTHYGGWVTGVVSYRYWYRDHHLRFWIQTYLYYDKSWIQKKAIKDKNVLNHLQRHFDLIEIESRNLGKNFKNFAFSQNFKSEIPVVYKAIYDDIKKMFNSYDSGTRQGRDKDAQKAWDAKIDEYLHTLSPVDGSFIDVEIQE